MKIIEPSVELINPVPYEVALNTIEIAGRTCYQSEDKMTDDSAEGFIRRIIKRGHESVLPNSLKTSLIVTYNIREWRHLLRLRCAPAAHPQMQQVANMARKLLTERYPVFFENLNFDRG